MNFTFDANLHLLEAIAIIFWIGVSWGDLKWLKSEIKHLRALVESILAGKE